MNTFNFQNLTDEVRVHMTTEVNADIKSEKLSLNIRLSEEGMVEYPKLLLEATKKGDNVTLGENLKDLMNPTEFNRGKQIKLPLHAEKTLAQNEFNRFYMRGVCAEAIKQEIEFVTVYRAQESKHRRKRSEKLVRQKINPTELLKQLQEHVDTDPPLFPSISSGLSIKF